MFKKIWRFATQEYANKATKKGYNVSTPQIYDKFLPDVLPT